MWPTNLALFDLVILIPFVEITTYEVTHYEISSDSQSFPYPAVDTIPARPASQTPSEHVLTLGKTDKVLYPFHV